MEQLSESLKPYKDTVGQIASIVTIGQFFSGAFICKDIHKKGTTDGIPAMPFIGGLVIGILMLVYAQILNDAAMLQVNVAAIVLNGLYLGFYCKYSEKITEDVLTPLSYGVGLIAILVGYTYFESPENLEFRYGLIVTILMLTLIGSPLLDIKNIMDSEDASSIPFPITFMGAIVSFLWFLYGIILLNYFMIVQNFIGLILCLVQLSLIFKYSGKLPRKSKNNKNKSKKKKDN